jgi:hypothetical protein
MKPEAIMGGNFQNALSASVPTTVTAYPSPELVRLPGSCFELIQDWKVSSRNASSRRRVSSNQSCSARHSDLALRAPRSTQMLRIRSGFRLTERA